jgi:DNA-binding GntR family transcriptional regulator
MQAGWMAEAMELGNTRSADEDTLAQTALDKIITLVRNGDLRPGAVVNETDLAKRFGMSRGPVREAVRRLEGRKLIVREAYQRARVTTLELKQIKEIFELRECLEGMACRLATRRMSDEALARLAEQVDQAGGRVKSEPSFTVDFKFSFHLSIVAGCENSSIQNVLTSEVYDLVRLYRWSSSAIPGRDGLAQKEHWQICRAMSARDEELAESLMRSHIQRSMQLMSTKAF